MNTERNFKSFGVRSFDVSSDTVDSNSRTIKLTASSETPYLRHDWDLGAYWEILGHNEKEVNLSRLQNKAAFLYEHDHSRQLGVIEKVELNTAVRNIFAEVRFSKNPWPTEVLNDIKDGIRTKISIGYKVLKAVITGYDDDGIPFVRVIEWEPIEISSVSTPADDSVSVLRSVSQEEQKTPLKIIIERSAEENNAPVEVVVAEVVETPVINPEVNLENSNLEKNDAEISNTPENNLENNNQPIENENIITDNNKRNNIIIEIVDNENNNAQNIENGVKKMNINSIFAKADAFGLESEVVNSFLRSGKTEEQFDEFVREFNHNKTKGINNMDQSLGLGVADTEIKNYDLFRAINAMRTGGDCEELAISREISKKSGQESNGGLIMPLAFWKKAAAYNAKTRAYNTAGGNASGTENLVQEILDASNLVDILRPLLVASKLGVRHVSGLVGDYAVPRKVSGSSNTWVGDSGASSESSAVFDKVVSKPTVLVSETQLYEFALKQMTPDAQMLAMDDMIKSRAVELDRVLFWGSGLNNEPTGIANTTGVNALSMGANGGAISRDLLIDMLASLGALDVNVDNARYVSNFKIQAALMKLKADAGSGNFVWNEFVSKFAITNNIPSNLVKGTSGAVCSGLIFGDFSDSMITEWGSPELIVDNLTAAKYGKVNLYMRQATNVLVRRPSAFTVVKDIIA